MNAQCKIQEVKGSGLIRKTELQTVSEQLSEQATRLCERVSTLVDKLKPVTKQKTSEECSGYDRIEYNTEVGQRLDKILMTLNEVENRLLNQIDMLEV